MPGTIGFRSVGLIVAIALAGTVYTARPAHAGGDLGKVLAGAVVGYLVYKALDDDDSGPRHHQRGYKSPPPRQHPGRAVCKRRDQHRWGQNCDHRGGYRDRDGYGDRGYGWDKGHKWGGRGGQGYGGDKGRKWGGRDSQGYGGRGGGGRR